MVQFVFWKVMKTPKKVDVYDDVILCWLEVTKQFI